MKKTILALTLALGLVALAPAMPAFADEADPETQGQETVASLEDEPAGEPVVVSDDATNGAPVIVEGASDSSQGEQDVAPTGDSAAGAYDAAAQGSDGTVVATDVAEPLAEEPSAAPDTQDVLDASDAEPASEATSGDGGALELMASGSSDEQAVSDGQVFTLSPTTASTKIAVAGNSAASGANVQLSNVATLLGEYWHAVSRDDGSFKIVNLAGNKALYVAGKPASGSNVSVISGEGTGWIIKSNGDGTVSLSPLGYTSLQLDLASGKTVAGTNLQLYKAKSDSAAQRFVLEISAPLTEAVASGSALSGQVLYFKSGVDKTRTITIADASKENGGNARLNAYKSTMAQRFVLRDMGNGLYAIQNTNSGKYLEVAGGGIKSGTNVRQWKGNSSLGQLWYFVKASDGTYSVRNAKSGLALSVPSMTNYEGANVRIQNVSNNARQKFSLSFTSLYGEGQVLRLSPSHATTMVAATASNSPANGTNTVIALAAYLPGQWWRVSSPKNMSFKLFNMCANVALSVRGDIANNANVNVSNSGTTWVVSINDGGTLSFSPQGKPNLVLEVESGGKTAGSNIRIHKSNGSAAQQFNASYNSVLTTSARKGMVVDEAVYNIASALNSKMVADIANGSTDPGANVRIHKANSTNAQKWSLEYVGSGLYRMRAASSGLCLGVVGQGRKDGSNVAHLRSDDTLFQLWYLTESSEGCVIHSAASGLAIDVDGGAGTNNANMEINKTNSAKSQDWLLVEKPLLANGTYAFSSDLTYYGMLVFEVKGGSTSSGANVQAHQTNGTEAQKWVLSYKGGGEYTIANKKSGLMLSIAKKSNSNGGNVIQETKASSLYQRWILTVTPTGGIGFKNVGSGKMMEVAGGKSDNGVNIQQRGAANVKYQSWHVKTNHDPIPSGKLGKFVSRMIYYTDIANVGYDMGNRWDIRDGGECDCSSLVITCLQEAGFNAKSMGATYTGDMKSVITSIKGWNAIPFDINSVKAGDILLNYEYHTCAVINGSGKTALIAQASIDENGNGFYGTSGDQSGYETNIKTVYVYPHGGWNCILRYTA